MFSRLFSKSAAVTPLNPIVAKKTIVKQCPLAKARYEKPCVEFSLGFNNANTPSLKIFIQSAEQFRILQHHPDFAITRDVLDFNNTEIQMLLEMGFETAEIYAVPITLQLHRPPIPPQPHECCGNGCQACVWEVYDEEMARYRTR